jgi:DNA-binding response OmpR family regulator
VDDDAQEAEALSRRLQGAGLEVRQEHDGTSAVVAAAQFQPDVVLLDLGLSGMSAIEVARRLRGDAYRTGVRIVALTSLSQPVEPARIAAVGIENYLVKPVDPVALLEVIGAPAGAAASRKP